MTDRGIVDVVGRGLIGSAFFANRHVSPAALFFASGVANSACADVNQFLRERDALVNAVQNFSSNSLFVYFSSCSVCDIVPAGVSPYVVHKLDMEKLVRQRSRYLIVRLPQVAGFTRNKNTLLNFLVDGLIGQRRLRIQRNAIRNIIDIDDVVKLVFAIINSGEYENRIVDVVNLNSVTVLHLLSIMENVFHISANFELVDGGSSYPVDVSVVDRFVDSVGIDFDVDYVRRVIVKYFTNTH
jgi:nucleoside-diphosphate-sugar epimerase